MKSSGSELGLQLFPFAEIKQKIYIPVCIHFLKPEKKILVFWGSYGRFRLN